MRAASVNEGWSPLAPRFTGKERDAETGLDYFGARYYSDQKPGKPGTGLGPSSANPSLLSLNYGYGGTNNNGNVRSQTIGPLNVTQIFEYDGLNRLEIVTENPTNPTTPACPDEGSQWCQKFEHGVWGNRLMVARSHLGVSPLEPTSFGSNNRMAGAYWDYDGAGNVTRNPLGETFRNDAENRQTASCTQDPYGCVASVGLGRTLYSYDAEGRRVKKEPPGGMATVYVHDAMGRLAAEYSAEGIQNPGVRYLTADHLGSTRVVTGESGQALECRDYHAFGEEILVEAGSPRQGVPCYTADAGVRQKFTGKERDGETGLDYFEARYYSAVQGRFTSADAPLADQYPEDPQSWNLYSYVRNNPLIYVDPTGTRTEICGLTDPETGEQQCEEISDDIADATRQDESYIVANGNIYLRNEDGTQGQQIGTFGHLGEDLSPEVVEVLSGLEQNAAGSNQMIAAVAGGSALVGTAVATAPVTVPLATEAATTVGTTVAAAGPAAIRLANRVAVEFTPSGALFTRSVINQNRYLRIGFSRKGAETVFRITGSLLRGKKIDVFNLGPIKRGR